MHEPPVPVYAVEHSFGLLDGYDIPIHTADWSTGLIVGMTNGAMIYTGINRGLVHVSIDIRIDPPDHLDADPWDDIAEASVHSATGNLRIHQLEYGRYDQPPPLPLLSARGPGDYRVRAHARGRDSHFDQAQEISDEHYLLVVWPAEPRPPLIIRATDRCGYGLRLSGLQAPRPVITAPKGLSKQRELELRALRDGARRSGSL